MFALDSVQPPIRTAQAMLVSLVTSELIMLGGMNQYAGPPGLLGNYLFMNDLWAFNLVTGIIVCNKVLKHVFVLLCIPVPHSVTALCVLCN